MSSQRAVDKETVIRIHQQMVGDPALQRINNAISHLLTIKPVRGTIKNGVFTEIIDTDNDIDKMILSLQEEHKQYVNQIYAPLIFQ